MRLAAAKAEHDCIRSFGGEWSQGLRRCLAKNHPATRHPALLRSERCRFCSAMQVFLLFLKLSALRLWEPNLGNLPKAQIEP
jgi:hypothetical protein